MSIQLKPPKSPGYKKHLAAAASFGSTLSGTDHPANQTSVTGRNEMRTPLETIEGKLVAFLWYWHSVHIVFLVGPPSHVFLQGSTELTATGAPGGYLQVQP